MREAVLLVGGQGTRLRPLTLTTPKQLLPVAGLPLLTHQITRLKAASVTHIVMATSYRADAFRDCFGDGSELGVEITYVLEESPLGTGGGIRNVTDRLTSGADDPVLVMNADNFSSHDLRQQLDQHLARGSDITLHLVEVDDARAFGCVPTDGDGRVTAFLEKMPEPVTRWVNAGCYAFRRSVIDSIPANQVVSVERDTFPMLLSHGSRIDAFKDSSYWLDVGTPAALVKCSADLVLRHGPSMVRGGAVVAAGATLRGGTAVSERAAVAVGADVDRSILMPGSSVGADSRLSGTVLGNDASVGAGCVLVDCVVGDEAVVPDGTALPPGSLVAPGDGSA